MAASVGHQVAQRGNLPTNETRGLEEVTVSGVDSVEVRVHLYERSFPAKPVSRVHVRRKQQRHRPRHAGLTRRCRGSSTVLPGRQRHPSRGVATPADRGPGPGSGGGRGGRSRPRCFGHCCSQPRFTSTRAAQSAARRWPQGHLLPPFGRCSDLVDNALRQRRNGLPERRREAGFEGGSRGRLARRAARRPPRRK